MPFLRISAGRGSGGARWGGLLISGSQGEARCRRLRSLRLAAKGGRCMAAGVSIPFNVQAACRRLKPSINAGLSSCAQATFRASRTVPTAAYCALRRSIDHRSAGHGLPCRKTSAESMRAKPMHAGDGRVLSAEGAGAREFVGLVRCRLVREHHLGYLRRHTPGIVCMAARLDCAAVSASETLAEASCRSLGEVAIRT